MDRKAMYKLSYGLFVLTAREDEKDNGCIINTAIQAASEPNQLSICVNKANYTHDMIVRTGKFTVSVLSLVRDTDEGGRKQALIRDLTALVEAYQTGVIPQGVAQEL